jgi:N-acetylmuramoyl-L-alanine amidase
VATLAVVVMRLMAADQASATSLSSGGQASVTQVTPVALPGLESGACLRYAPTRGRRDLTIFLDAGHGGLDPGVVGTTAAGRSVLEKDATLGVATRLAVLLRADGFSVVMARTADTTVVKLAPSDSSLGSMSAAAEHRDLLARVACANAAGAAVLLSIHFDGFGDPSVGGTETVYDPVRPFAGSSSRLATDLQSALVAALGASDRGVLTDDQLAAPTLTASGASYGHLIELGPASAGWVDDPSQMPGALVEPLFLTNPAEAQIASDPAGQETIAEALEAGLLNYVNARS